MSPLVSLTDQFLVFYIWVVVANAVFRWMIAFDLVDTDSKLFLSLWYLVSRSTEPILKPIRSLAPNIGVIDVSHVIVILVLILAREFLWQMHPALGYQ